MHSTNILQDIDFNKKSIYRSHAADAKLHHWEVWAARFSTEKQKKEIERAMKKSGRGRL